MNFLKILFWIVLTTVVVVFSINNWVPVSLNLWGGLVADVKLPILLVMIFLLGFVPTLAYYRTRNWRLHRRMGTVERELADARGIKQFNAPRRSPASPESNAGPELSLDKPLPPETGP